MTFQKLICLTLIQLLFQGCLTNRKMNRYVRSYYSGRGVTLTISPPKNILLHLDSVRTISGYSECHNESLYVVPLIFYTYAREKKRCDINPIILVKSVYNEIAALGKNDSVKEKFEQFEINLFFMNIPSYFYHDYKGHVINPLIMLPYTFIRIDNENVYKHQNYFVLNYKIRNKNTLSTVNEGNVHIPFQNMYIRKRFMESRKEFIKDYVLAFDSELFNIGHEAAKTIINEMKAL